MVYNLLQDYSRLRVDSRAQVNLSPVLDKDKTSRVKVTLGRDSLDRVSPALVSRVKVKVKDKVVRAKDKARDKVSQEILVKVVYQNITAAIMTA